MIWGSILGPVRDQLAGTEERFLRELRAMGGVAAAASPVAGAGGKRVRPLLLLLVASTGSPRWDRACRAACAVEMVHTASLLHDDVLDEAPLRRGAPTACVSRGSKTAVLAGDVLYCRAMELCLEDNLETSALLLARASRRMAQAEAAETERQGDLNRSPEGCVDLAREKTGSLFSAASEIGAHLGGIEDERGRFARFGEHLGTAFQIVDDVLDYVPSGPDRGKRPLQDLRQRRATLPLILALATGALTGWPPPGTALGVLQECGALDRAMRTARQEAEAARGTLRGMAQVAGLNALEELCRLVTERQW